MPNIIPFSALQKTDIGSEFEGCKFNQTEVTFILVNAAPSKGVRLHSHPYTEIFIIQEGNGQFTIGEKTMNLSEGQVVIVPPETPHKFSNTGNTPLRQVDIHLSERFITNWLEE